ncbi:MAG TPA: putative baseplate assembly protein, partial [Gemmatimonadaceae bacterium]|nr:putative baseplate assembly protein [Gemmatimonadaceae bacterium]
SGPADRHYAIDRAGGRVFFGDGERGRIPPPGASVALREFSAGGGSVGNVRAGAVDQLIAEVPGVEKVFNARAAEGGADGETLESFATRGPATVRHRGRAIAARDYETMAREASPAVAFVRAMPARTPAGRTLPGWVTLIVIPGSEEPQPMPSAGLRHAIETFIGERAPADLAHANRIQVIGPDYYPVDVSATIVPAPAAAPGEVERAARAAVARFLHPLFGGPRGRGWDLGRDIFLSDLAAVLEQVVGVDYVEELALLHQGVPFGERVPIAADRIAVAGTVTVTLRMDTGERA